MLLLAKANCDMGLLAGRPVHACWLSSCRKASHSSEQLRNNTHSRIHVGAQAWDIVVHS